MEKISMTISESHPRIQESRDWNREFFTSFGHLGDAGLSKNEVAARELDVFDFRKQIEYLRSETGSDIDFFYRTILQNRTARDLFIQKLGVSPRDSWESEDSYLQTENPDMTYDEYLNNHYWKSLAASAFCYENWSPDGKGIIEKFSDNEVFELIKIYSKEASRLRDETLEKIESMRDKFVTDLKSFAEHNNFELDLKIIQKRLNSLHYDVFDQYYSTLRSSREKSLYICGDYNSQSHTVRLKLSPFARIEESTLRHEHIHGVSGQTHKLTLLYFEEDHAPIVHTQVRTGARRERSEHTKDNFRWLNEAITEKINVDIKDITISEEDRRPYHDSYPDERRLLELILESGEKMIEPKYFYQAYFESDTEDPNDLVARNELYQEMSSAYGSPRFLVKLDDMVTEVGIKQAVRFFKESGKDSVIEWWNRHYNITEPHTDLG